MLRKVLNIALTQLQYKFSVSVNRWFDQRQNLDKVMCFSPKAGCKANASNCLLFTLGITSALHPVYARLAQLVKSLTTSQKDPGLIPTFLSGEKSIRVD